MFFTQEDYKKIQQWLTKNSVKDTEFNEANIPFNGNEIVSIVQGTQNKKVFLKDLVSQIFNLGISDFVNITDKYDAPNISLEEAIRLVPSRARKEGQVITFLDKENHWHIYQFKGVLNQWNVLDTWEDLFDWEKIIIDSILPDEEDLTKSLPDENGNSYLSLKDREYNPEDFSGLGKVILRKNIVEIEDSTYGKVKKNVLYQDMINKENTVYEIRYDFDLNCENIVIPKACTLLFNGGSINNGSINGDYTEIIDKTLGFLNNVTFKGTWNVKTAYPEWYKYEDDENIQKAIDSFNNVTLIKNTYNIKKPLIVKNNTIINGNGSTLLATDNLDSVICANTRCYYINISNIIIDCNNKAECGLNLLGVNYSIFNYIQINKFLKYGIYMASTKDNPYDYSCYNNTINSGKLWVADSDNEEIEKYGIYITKGANDNCVKDFMINAPIGWAAVDEDKNTFGACTGNKLLSTSIEKCNIGILIDSEANYIGNKVRIENYKIGIKIGNSTYCRDNLIDNPVFYAGRQDSINIDNALNNKNNIYSYQNGRIDNYIHTNNIYFHESDQNDKYKGNLNVIRYIDNIDQNRWQITITDSIYRISALYNKVFDDIFTIKQKDSISSCTIKNVDISEYFKLPVVNSKKDLPTSLNGIQLGNYISHVGTIIYVFEEKKPYIWVGNDWSPITKDSLYINIGNTSNRPNNAPIGFQYYDTTLKKYIVWNGAEWTNVDGTILE